MTLAQSTTSSLSQAYALLSQSARKIRIIKSRRILTPEELLALHKIERAMTCTREACKLSIKLSVKPTP